MRRRPTNSGFTLVELLVVIAILGILAAIISVAGPRAIRAARLSAMNANMNQIRTILVEYYTRTNSYPPSYGYLSNVFLKDPNFTGLNRADMIGQALLNGDFGERDAFFLLPWMSYVKEHGNEDLYDNFSRLSNNSYDTDADGIISRLEFAPRGFYNGGSQTYEFNYEALYTGNNTSTDPATLADVNDQLATREMRPFVYIAVNEQQYRKFRKIIYDFAGRQGNPSNPRPFNLDQPAIDAINTQLLFPPPSYDKYVLMSVGPNFLQGTNGLIAEFDTGRLNLADFPAVNQYHILGLATYFLATRDAENGGQGDGELDFDYTARVSGGQKKNTDNDMPGQYPKGDGPVIKAEG